MMWALVLTPPPNDIGLCDMRKLRLYWLVIKYSAKAGFWRGRAERTNHIDDMRKASAYQKLVDEIIDAVATGEIKNNE